MRAALLLLLGCSLACFGSLAVAETPSERLTRLGDEYWQASLRNDPVQATALGDRRYDHLLSDNSPEGRAREQQELEQLHAAVSDIPLEELSADERVTHSMLLETISGDLTVAQCGFDDWVVDPLGGPQVSMQNLPALHKVDTPEQAAAMVQRWQAIGPYVDQHTDNLRGGLARQRWCNGHHPGMCRQRGCLWKFLRPPAMGRLPGALASGGPLAGSSQHSNQLEGMRSSGG